MSKRMIFALCGVIIATFVASNCFAAGMFVATAKNFRGALYQGVGPTPAHASEDAIVKCSQDSFIPPSCKVVCVRMECPPPVCLAPPPPLPQKAVRKSLSKVQTGQGYADNVPRGNYSWGRPMP